MDDLIRRSAVIDAIRGEREYLIAHKQLGAEHVLAKHADAVIDSIPAVDAVERGVFEQVAWERDIAVGQLSDIGKSFGEKMDDVAKVVRCEDCKHYRCEESEYVPDAVVVWCADDNYPYSGVMPDGWFCAGGKRREEERNAKVD